MNAQQQIKSSDVTSRAKDAAEFEAFMERSKLQREKMASPFWLVGPGLTGISVAVALAYMAYMGVTRFGL
ncbi:hypothetical protein [Pseudomonas sp. JUb52]|uniref:hypothetical protein n=1 Tax=Pseudomonas sp. JUb52 TaxID=2485127 RepID=UPI001049AF48|nr:hypothetical protein [Pseudomonas sp. JUb52]TCQ81599.1 hypothetical protein EC839_1266 [Pseudomonas sp. JUb52]